MELVDAISASDFRLRQYRFPLPVPASDAMPLESFGTPEPSEHHAGGWPVLYILTNDDAKVAYIGETTNYYRRMAEHRDNAEKQKHRFDKTLLIDSPSFNQSSTFDYENRLIELFLADEQYKVVNKNNGHGQLDYYQRPQYRQQFRDLWAKLVDGNYAVRGLEELENSDLFKYSPYKTLTPDQLEAIDELWGIVGKNEKSVAFVTGTPGTGKTILAMSLLFRLKNDGDKNLKVALVSPMVSLRGTLGRIAKSLEGLKALDIIGPSDVARHGHYDVLLVDEAHRLTDSHGVQGVVSYWKTCDKLGLSHAAHQFDWIVKSCDKAVFFYDPKQQVKATGLAGETMERLRASIEDRAVRTYDFVLTTQMRVRGGDEYLDFIYDLLTANTSALKTRPFGRLFTSEPFDPRNDSADEAPKYQLALVGDFERFCDLQKQKEAESGLSRMVAGYAWEWTSKNDASAFDIMIDGIRKRWNSQAKDWVNSLRAVDEVGSIHTVQGYDLNYGFVIIGPDLRFDAERGEVVSSRVDFRDKGAKRTADDAGLHRVIVNAYYVLLTRGMLGTFIYVCDPALREYLGRYIPTI